MSVSAAGSQGAYNYLQSLLQQQSGVSNAQPPLQSLLDAFYPTSDTASASGATSTTTVASSLSAADGSAAGSCFSTDTFGALISLQGSDPVADKAQSIFAGLDSNGDGAISQSEFEDAFGSGADTSKVDALFNSLDSNGDGSVSQDELTAAAQASHARHHHHAHGGGHGGGLEELMNAVSGANSQTTSNSDGSTSTTITYADGSSVVLNSAPSSSTSNNSSGSSTGQQTANVNLIEKLIQMQSQLIGALSGVSGTASVTA